MYTHFQIITDPSNPYTLNIPLFCQKCGQCCDDIAFPDPLRFENLINILSTQEKSEPGVLNLIINPEKQQRMKEKPCYFLLPNKTCAIYKNRPKLCREWYPRGGSACPAYDHHVKLCQLLLANHIYQIGVREIIYIGDVLDNPIYPSVANLAQIDSKILLDYIPPSGNVARELWKELKDLNLSEREKQLIQIINPLDLNDTPFQ